MLQEMKRQIEQPAVVIVYDCFSDYLHHAHVVVLHRLKRQIEQPSVVIVYDCFFSDYLHHDHVVVLHPRVVVHGVDFDADFVSVVDFRSCLFVR